MPGSGPLFVKWFSARLREKRLMRIASVLILTPVGLSAANAAPPCHELAEKVTKKFAAERNMSDVDRAAKCSAISVVISDLTDLAVTCGADQKFMDGTYLPLAKAVGDEAPKACHR
jgi:hypothetical protein